MKRMLFIISSVLLTVAASSWYLSFGSDMGRKDQAGTAFAQGTGKVIFKVRCYDEGKAALQGMKGIQRIETGFHYLHETDTVYFDPEAVTIEEMETALKKAGTYVGTIHEKGRN